MPSTIRVKSSGGEGGIRTRGTFGTPDFESGTFDHSATSPRNLGLHQCVKNGKINHSNYGLNIVKLTIY